MSGRVVAQRGTPRPRIIVRIGSCTFVMRRRLARSVAILAALVVVVVIAAVILGSQRLELTEITAVLTGDARPALERSVFSRRLPRALTAALVGALLGLSGAAFQSLSRNPLGSPDIIGFTSGAATGAVFQIVVFDGGMLATAAAAVLGGVLTALIVYALARRDGITGGLRLVLVGIGVGAVVSAITALLIARADVDDALLAQVWTSGSLIGRGWPHVWAATAALAIVLPLLLWLGRDLALIEIGDDSALGLGVRVERTRFLAMVVAVIAAAVGTAATGPIAFIAFASGQIARRLAPVPGALIGLSALVGAALLVGADLLAQNLDIGLRTPVGLVTSVLGGVYLLWLLARRA